jgi:signal transduction histidine kinase
MNHNLFAAYENEEDGRLAHIISLLIWATWVGFLFIIILGVFFHDNALIILTLFGSILLVVPMILLRQQKLQTSSLLLVLIEIGVVTIIATVGQGIRDLALLGLPIIVLFAGLVLNKVFFRISIGLISTAIVWLVLGEIFGWFVPKPFEGEMSNWFYMFGMIIIILLAALAVDLFAKNVRTNLELARNEIAHRKQVEKALEEQHKALEQQNQFLVALQDTTVELISQLDSKKLLENIVRRACELVGTTSGALNLIDPVTNQLLPQVGIGVLQDSLNQPVQLGEGLAGVVWQSGEMLVIPDYDQWEGRLRNFSRGKLGSVIGLPLLSGEDVVGVLITGSEYTAEFPFDTNSIEILNQFAHMATVAVQNARLFSDLQTELNQRKRAEAGLTISEQAARQMTEQLQTVIEIGNKITSGLGFEDRINMIYQQCQQLGDSDTFYVATYDDQTGMVSFPFFMKEGKMISVAARQLKEFPGLTLHVIKTKRTLYIPDESNPPTGLSLIRTPGIPTMSYIGIPLVLNDRVIGVLSLQSNSPNAYTPEQIKTLELVATQVAITIQNSQLYEQVRQELDERMRAEQRVKEYSENLEKMVEERTNELHEAQEQLVRNERLATLGMLAGSVGHELRNPLGVIQTSTYYLDMVQPDANEKIKQHYAMIKQEVHNADKIISELLDFSRNITAERMRLSVPDIVKSTLERNPVPAAVEVVVEIPIDLPKIFADPRQVEQILGNLTSNACQEMVSQGSSTSETDGGRLTISARDQGKMVAIAVTDTGQGISPENMKKLFEPLFSTKTKGIGLGLSVSQKYAEANNGWIEVKSQLGKGSTFTLVVPVREE